MIKLIIASVLCIALPLFAACGNGFSDYGSDDISNVLSEQTEATENSEQSQTTESAENAAEAENAANAEDTDKVTIMYITINSNKLEVELAENSSVTALIEILEQGDITYTADDYGGFEKVGNIGCTLPQNNVQITTEAGDVILYQGNNICLYYGTNSWSFTRIGKISGYSTEQLKTLLCAGEGEIEVTISLK